MSPLDPHTNLPVLSCGFFTPVYFGNFTAQLKQFIDVIYCVKRCNDGHFFIHTRLKNVNYIL